MKNFLTLSISGLLLMSLVASCKDDRNVISVGEDDGYELTEANCTVLPLVPDCEPGDEIEDFELTDGSRSQLTLGSTGMKFSWEDNDYLVVYSKDGDAEISMTYTMKHHDNEGNAKFNVGELPIKATTCYLAFGQREDRSNHDRLYMIDRDHIQVSYAGQKQIGNKTTGHLGAYDYIAAASIASSSGIADFEFHHLGATLSLIFEDFPNYVDKQASPSERSASGILWTKCEMYTDDNDFLQPERELSMRTGLQVANEVVTYSPALNAINVAENCNASRFSVDLRAHNDDDASCTNKDAQGHCNCGVGLIDDKNNGNLRLRVFMEVPPFEFSGTKRFIFRLTGYDTSNNNKQVSYYGCFDKPSPIIAGSAVQMKMKPNPSSVFDLKVKLHLDWHNKSVYNASRTENIDHIGDPGDFENFTPPTYLYAWVFSNGTLKEKRYMHGKELEGKWKQSVDAFVYDGDFKFNFSLDEIVEKCHVYVAASTTPLSYLVDTTEVNMDTQCPNRLDTTSHFHKSVLYGTINSTRESEIRQKTFSLSDANKDKIRDIWSTPYTSEAGAFVGEVATGMNINLHHVAAKVDLQWNSAYQVTKVGVTGFQLSGLKLFEPTENEGDNLSARIENSTFDSNMDSWNATHSNTKGDWYSAAVNYGCGEFWNATAGFDIHQDIVGLPAGTYKVRVQSFYRDGGHAEAWEKHNANPCTESLRVKLYAKSGNQDQHEVAVKSIFDASNQVTGVGVVGANDAYRIPDDMNGASQYFNAGLYKNEVNVTVAAGETLRIGLKKEGGVGADWCIFDNFTLIGTFSGNGEVSYNLNSSDFMDQWYNGRKVFYIPQYKSDPIAKTTNITVLTRRYQSDGQEQTNDQRNVVPFDVEDVYTSWFRGNVVISQ